MLDFYLAPAYIIKYYQQCYSYVTMQLFRYGIFKVKFRKFGLSDLSSETAVWHFVKEILWNFDISNKPNPCAPDLK